MNEALSFAGLLAVVLIGVATPLVARAIPRVNSVLLFPPLAVALLRRAPTGPIAPADAPASAAPSDAQAAPADAPASAAPSDAQAARPRPVAPADAAIVGTPALVAEAAFSTGD